MSAPSDTATHAAPHPVQTFAWSLRRELWENRAIYVAPLAVAAIVLAGFLYSSYGLVQTVGHAASADPGRAGLALHIPYAAAAGAPFIISLAVAVFYCLGALHGERRDRSLLFWKSLPVSDRTAVLAKATVPLVIQPLAVLVIAVVTQLIMLAWSTAILAINGVDPGELWGRLELPLIWAVLPYGLVVNALWFAPIVGWLLLVSAWAKRTTFVWAVAPWLTLSLFELLAFHTHHLWSLIDERLFGGFAQAFSVDGRGRIPIQHLSQVDPGRFLALPGLWGGLVVFAACLAGCVWLRRTRDPI